MSRPRGRRAVVAALLSFVQPGLGHLYLRAWLRALPWAALWFGSLGVVLVASEVGLSLGGTVAVLAGVFGAVESLPTEGVVSMVAVTLLAALDAYRLGSLSDRREEDAQCPRCGRELDPALEFCHWCTVRLEGEES